MLFENKAFVINEVNFSTLSVGGPAQLETCFVNTLEVTKKTLSIFLCSMF